MYNYPMLPLAFGMIVFFFLAIGAVAFLICVLIPPLRRYALSTALWCATWGPVSIALLTLAGVALVATSFLTGGPGLQTLAYPKLLSAIGWGYLIVGVASATIVATAAAWLHQFLVHRFTFALFRLYATVVIAGIGSVFGWMLSWWSLGSQAPIGWLWSLLCMVILILSFGAAAYKGARSLRGKAPTRLTWLTAQEFTGP